MGPRRPQTARPGRLALTPAADPARGRMKPLGVPHGGRGPATEEVGMTVADGRHHLHMVGVTGSGKSTALARQVIEEASNGRGVVLLDCQGDLAARVLDRLPSRCGDRLVLLDPRETGAPAAWNVLSAPVPAAGGAVDGSGREWAAENVVGVFRSLYAASWGPRMDDVLRAGCLTLVRRPGSSLADLDPLLTDAAFRREVVRLCGEPDGMGGFWSWFDHLSDGARAQVCAPILSRLRGVLSRRFARDLLTAPASSFDLTEVLDGGILIARLAKGEIGESAAQLIGSLLLSGLWAHTLRRARVAQEQRRDATIVIDECHNFLHLPIGVDTALAESRGYRVALVLAHQNLAQLRPAIREAVEANARNKLFFTVSPTDAHTLARHVGPYFTEADLSRRPAFEAIARVMHNGQDMAPFTVATDPLDPPVPGRADALRAAARARTGVSDDQRARAAARYRVAATRPGRPGPGRPGRPRHGPAASRGPLAGPSSGPHSGPPTGH